MDPTLILWAVVLIAIAIVLFCAELFVPSAGVIGIVATLCLIAGIVLLFKVDTTLGLLSAIVTLFTAPIAFLLALKAWPHTPVARWLTLRSDGQSDDDDEHDPRRGSDQVGGMHPLVGKIGETITDLKPVGMCLLAGQRTQCMAEAGMIAAKIKVRVVAVTDMEIRVRVVEE